MSRMNGNGTGPGQPGALTVAEGLEVVILNENEVLVQRGTRSTPSELLRDSELRGFLGPVMARLSEAPRTVDELAAGVPPEDVGEVRELLGGLRESGFVVPAGTELLDGYLSYAFEGARPLADRSVALLGAGPLGARIAAGLLQHGVGRVTLLDDRPADAVWRRFVPFAGTGDPDGRPACALLAERLQALGHGPARVQAGAPTTDTAALERAIGEADLAVVAFERPQLRLTQRVNRVCVRDERPWLLAGIDGNVALAGPLFVPPHTACYNCFRTLADASAPNAEMAERYRRHLAAGRSASFFPGLPAHADLAAGYATLAAAHYLARGTAFLVGRALFLDFGDMSMDLEDVLVLPRCPVCARTRPAYEPAFAPRVVQAVAA